MEPEMKIEDISPWHHLIFVEELAYKDECGLCNEEAVGPIYICLECDFIQHKSCPKPTIRVWEKDMQNHYPWKWHHLMLVEEVENKAEEEVVCSGCQQTPSLPAYKCSIPGCSLLLHKSCAGLSHAVLHPQHSDHVLTLETIDLTTGSRGKDKRCNGCNKLIECLYYGCRRCNVYLHPKCSSPEMEQEVEPLPLLKDLSPWHHLIFVDELADDVSDEANCSRCYEQAVGPVYKCLECDFIQHKSCPHPNNRGWAMYMKSDYYCWRHHLRLVEALENRGEEEVVCSGCQEPTSLPAYKCCHHGCSFILHKSCTELPLAVLHLQHADHVLTLRSSRVKCNFCLKSKKSLLYGCYPCKFDLHIPCVSNIKCLPRLPFVAGDCHKHTVIPIWIRDTYTCQACGEEAKCSAYVCLICGLMMDKSCCDFPHSIQTTLHGPSLIFIPSVRLINKEDRIFCRLCRKRVNTRYGAYYCVKCGYILHLKCARRYKDKDSTTESASSNCEEYTIYLFDWLKAAEHERFDKLEKFKHFDHPSHDLILSHKRPGYDKKCKACLHFIFFTPYYSCGECNFFLHVRCAKLPTIIKRGLLHKHPLAFTTSCLGYCCGCYKSRKGYGYKCGKCDRFEMDVQCGLLPEALEHVLHQHILYRVTVDERFEQKCNVCRVLSVCYVCTDCKFGLCGLCVALPPTVRYQHHSHLLSATFVDEDQEDNYCLICEKNFYSKKLFYWCKECDFTVHSECILE